MHTVPLPFRAHRAGYTAVLVLIGVGAALFLMLVLNWSPPAWSRPALGLQALAVLLVLVLARRHPPLRLLLYPLILAGGIYLWDTTLPPPSLPEGPLRQIVPGVLLAGLLVDSVMTLWPMWRRPAHTQLFHGNLLPLSVAAQLLTMTPEELRARVQTMRRTSIIADDGTEFLTLDDVCALILRSTLDDLAP